MNPNVTVGYLAEQLDLDRRDGEAARRWQAAQAATARPQGTAPGRRLLPRGVAKVRPGACEWVRSLMRRQPRPARVPVPSTPVQVLPEI